MGKYDGIILLSDMDGTLLNAESRVSEKNKEALSTFIKEGGRFGIATGRSLTNAMRFLEGVPINGYCILGNGGLLYDIRTNTYLEEYGLNKKQTKNFLLKCLREKPRIGIQIYGRDMGHIISPEELADPVVVNDHLPVSFDSLHDIQDIEWIKILFSGTKEDILWLMEATEYLETEKIVDRVRSATNYYEFLPVNCNKGNMLNVLRKYINKDQKIYAVGDYYNDVEMIRLADVGIAMQNAPDSVKAHADFVGRDCNHNAIADIIENIILNNKTD